MRGIKKIEHITTYRTFCVDTDNILYDKSTINEAYIIKIFDLPLNIPLK